MRGPRPSRGPSRRLTGLAALAALVGLVVAGSAATGTSTKPYTANICSSSQLTTSTYNETVCPEPTSPAPALPGGTTVVYLTLHNKANPQSLGSANVGLPTGPSPTTYAGAEITSGTGTATSTSSLVTLRNLNLAPDRSVTVKLTLSTPSCTSGTYNWGAQGVLRIKQSNDFNGPPGNDFTLAGTGNSLTATLSGDCHLAVVTGHQPADTEKNATITDAPYSSGGAIQVGLYDSGDNLVSQTGACPGSSCISAGFSGGDASATLGGTKQQPLVGGIASFSGLSLDKASASLYRLTFASSDTGVTGATSSGFSIVEDGCSTTSSGGTCTVSSTFTRTGSTPTTTADASTTFGGAGTMALTFFSQGAVPAGCEYFKGTGSAGVNLVLQGTTTGFSVVYGISDQALKKVYGTNYGQPNVPICIGAQRLENGHLYTCQEDIARGLDGWTGKVLDPTTNRPNGQFDTAACNADGMWWNIAPNFQDPASPAGYAPLSIEISGWGSATASDGTALRTFTISVPSPWDWKGMG